MPPGLLDRLKMRVIIWTRYLNRASIEWWSRHTFRRRRPPRGWRLALIDAREHYESSVPPAGLRVPAKMPSAARLPLSYMLPYYYATGLVFKLYQYAPISRTTPWTARNNYSGAFPANREGWTDTNTDAGFARLMLQGPNPFLLRRVDDRGGFEADYSRYFDDILPPVVSRFRLRDGALCCESVRVGDVVSRPGDAGWEQAKLTANAADARYCIFVRHLLDTHLFVGQAYALSAYALPPEHPLRGFLDFFTYGTLVVNDFAYRLLITPSSYFLQSGFITEASATRLFQNSVEAFSLDHLIVPLDIAQRGIDEIPDHPYVQDGLEAWNIFHDFVRQVIDGIYRDDDAMRADADLMTWYKELASLLPNEDITDRPLTDRALLIDVLTCLLYNNVSHEVCGDFSPYVQSATPLHRKLVDQAAIASGDLDDPPRLADTFLFDQGAYAGRFNNGGNNLLTLDPHEYIDDSRLRNAFVALQQRLAAHDARLEERNRERDTPFYRMMPRHWEVSISF